MKKLFTLFLLGAGPALFGQNLINDGGTITIAANDTITVPGYFLNSNGGNVANNGVMEVAKNFTATGTSQQLGTGIYRFNGTSPQLFDIGLNHISSIQLDNDSNLIMNSDAKDLASLTFVNGKIIGNGNTLTMASLASPVTGADSSRYFVCNSSADFKYLNVDNSDTAFFPIGPDTANYNPAWLVNNGTTDNISGRVFTGVLQQGETGAVNTDQHLVDRTWVFKEGVAGSTTPVLTLQWDAGDQRAAFDPQANLGISNYNTTLNQWNYLQQYLQSTGTGPYTVARTYTQALGNLGAFIIADDGSQIPLVGLDEEEAGNFTVYPNPLDAGTPIMLQAEKLSNKEVTFTVYDSAGQLVYSEKNAVSQQGILHIDLPVISSGIYVFTLTDGVKALYKSKVVIK